VTRPLKSVTLNRPDKIHATRRGGIANVEFVSDGKTVTLLGKDAHAYTQVEAPDTIDELVDVLRKTIIDHFRGPTC